VVGFDIDEQSILQAQANAAVEGLTARVIFSTRDAADPALEGTFDVVVAFECVHDMARPVEALRAMRSRVADSFIAPGDDVERYKYGCSALHCLPVGMTERPSAETGTVMRPNIMRRYATEAGFSAVEAAPMDFDFWRFYRLIP
jgi:2-polyprenyl-3-methyl-5-hydroxy-6-metoxy-1,4-benzoquinol methylase